MGAYPVPLIIVLAGFNLVTSYWYFDFDFLNFEYLWIIGPPIPVRGRHSLVGQLDRRCSGQYKVYVMPVSSYNPGFLCWLDRGELSIRERGSTLVLP